MKKLLYLILTGTLFISCTATRILVNFDEPIVRTFDVSGTKDELFINANRWMISVFRDARSVIQFSDKPGGILIGKYLLHQFEDLHNIYSPDIYAIIEINVKDGKSRISVKPDNWDYYWSSTQDLYSYNKEKAIADIDALCESFNKSLQSEKVNF